MSSHAPELPTLLSAGRPRRTLPLGFIAAGIFVVQIAIIAVAALFTTLSV
jgi:hypothetical protein